jgi:tRNA-Thr(GGU) m(6)t(6)A37 methyltransferase TsaA
VQIVLDPIGFVRNRVKEPIHRGWDQITSLLEVRPDLEPALEGIEEFSHILVLFWLHGVDPEKRRLVRIRPEDHPELPEVGVLATRSQYRPNPIGATVVRLLSRDGSKLTVQGLDAVDGTPVIDIKPWTPETVEDVRWPWWMDRLRELMQGEAPKG